MKILKYAGILLLVLAVVFLSLGLMIPAFEYSAKVTVQAPSEKCWIVLHDTTKMKKWINGFVSLRQKSGESFQPGAVYEIIIVQGERYVMEEVIQEIKAPELLRMRLTNDAFVSEFTYTLVHTNFTTEITNHHKVVGNNLIWRSLLFMSTSYLKSEAQKELDLLKLEIETGEFEFD